MILIKYKRNEHGRRIGVVVALDRERIGFSLCNKKDKWDREKALEIALDRAENGFDKIPHSIYLDYYEMYNRSGRYFKH